MDVGTIGSIVMFVTRNQTSDCVKCTTTTHPPRGGRCFYSKCPPASVPRFRAAVPSLAFLTVISQTHLCHLLHQPPSAVGHCLRSTPACTLPLPHVSLRLPVPPASVGVQGRWNGTST
jgi:hypothetical protein